MWLILLDYSGSMGEPFAGSGTFQGRATAAAASVKLDAARQALYLRVRGLDPSERVIVIGFTSVAQVLFDGRAAQTGELEDALDALQPTGGTDVAGAMDVAAARLAAEGVAARARVLLVSDCKSELEPAIDAANRLAQVAFIIDVLLIDPDSTTEAAARALIRLGEVQAVTSAADMETVLLRADDVAEQTTAVVGRALEEAQNAAQRAMADRVSKSPECDETPVAFTAGHPATIGTTRASALHVVVHPSDLAEEVAALMRTLLQTETTEPNVAMARARTRLPHGASLRVEPIIPGVRVNPTRIDLTWEGIVERLTFWLYGDADAVGTQPIGSVDVWYGPALIARIPLSLEIVDGVGTGRPVVSRQQLLGTVFPSYSRLDKAIVNQCRAYYEALGIGFLQDTEELRARSGEHWRRAIRGLILRADAFQLYWSPPAAISDEVEAEWRYAISLDSVKDPRFVRPLRWSEQVPKLPQELSHLEMGWLPLERAPARELPKVSAIRGTVIPLVDCAPEQRRIVERELRDAIYHVEMVTERRCYPPPVLLVDEHVVKRRSSHGVPKADEGPLRRLAAAGAILQSMALDIHTRFERGKPEGLGVDLTLSLPDDARRHAMYLAEWVIRFATRSILGWHGFTYPREWGVETGPPVASSDIDQRPSERIRAALAIPPDHGIEWEPSRERDADVDRAVTWLTAQGFRIQSRASSVSWKATPQKLRPILIRTMIPELRDALDHADPLAATSCTLVAPNPSPSRGSAPHYFEAIHRDDCAAIAESLTSPHWRTKLDEFVAALPGRVGAPAGPIEALALLLDSLRPAYAEATRVHGHDVVFAGGYSVYPEVFDGLSPGAVDLVTRQGNGYLCGTFPALERLFVQTSAVFVDALKTLRGGSPQPTSSVLSQAHTYGVFIRGNPDDDRALAEWAAANGIRDALTLPGSDRILLCVGALSRWAESIPDTEVREKLRRSVLLHELFHAAVAAAFGADAARLKAQDEAIALEESLAVWLEYDAARTHPGMAALVDAYASGGTYPVWPYAGMAAVERRFLSGGYPLVRQIIDGMIDDPVSTRARFDAAVASGA